MKLILFGNNQTSAVCWSYFKNETDYDIVCFTVDKTYITSDCYLSLPVVPFEEIDNHYDPKNHSIFISIGYQNLNKLREERLSQALAKGYKPANFISPHAYISHDAKIGDHNFILENNVIQPFVHIANNNIIWSGNHIGHHTIIGNNNYISSHVVISGSCTIGDNNFFGVNATTFDNVDIKHNNIIGANTLISKNIDSNQVYYAEKAKLLDKPSNLVKI